MKAIIKYLAISLTFLAASVSGNELTGKWQGNLAVGQQNVPIVFHVEKKRGKFQATMDSPMQGATGIPVKSVSMTGNKVSFDIAVAAARYDSVLEGERLSGTWKQSGQAFSLEMSKGETLQTAKKN